MKYLIIPLLIIISFAGDLQAQIEKGTFTLGGDLYFKLTANEYENGSRYSSISLYLGPGFGFFPVNNLEFGIKPELGRTETSITYFDGSDYSSSRADLAVQLYGRKYFLQNHWKPFVELGGQCEFARINEDRQQTNPDGVSSISSSIHEELYFVGVLTGGVAFFVRDYLSIDLLLRYKMGINNYTIYASDYSDYSSDSNNYEFYTGVGLRYFFLRNE